MIMNQAYRDQVADVALYHITVNRHSPTDQINDTHNIIHMPMLLKLRPSKLQ
jgi:hypothetical protein